ncbi:MAG TPA: hypothetical protein VNI77_05800 [Nitrososphaera sp.]|nr:hypothetical protein [Nitrososphaera sp.]
MVKARNLIAGLAVLAATVLIAGTVAGFSFRPSMSEEPQPIEHSISLVRGPDAFLETRGKSAIVVEAAPKFLNLKRGESATIYLNVEHRTTTDGLGTLTVVPSGVRGGVILPSMVNETTPEERANLVRQGKPIPGSIDLAPFVQYSTNSVELSGGEKATIVMTFTVPEDLPVEMTGKSLHFTPNLKIAEMQDVPPDRASDAVVFTDMVTVIVED